MGTFDEGKLVDLLIISSW